jgi:formate C-acetyltransferase
MATVVCDQPRYAIKTPTNLSSRIQWLREYYFQGVQRAWNNEYTSWTTGTPWDFQYNELTFYIVPETYTFLQTFRSSFKQVVHPVQLDRDFWTWSLPERRAWFNREVMLHYLPKEILPGDLIAGGRFNIQTSACLTERETRERDNLVYGPNGSRAAILWFHNHGYGNAGATSGHLIPDYGRIIRQGWKAIYAELEGAYAALSTADKDSKKGGQLRAMMIAATLPRDLATEYCRECTHLAEIEPNASRRTELTQMADNLARVPWNPPQTFWEAVQAL